MAMHEVASSELQAIVTAKLHEAVSSDGSTMNGESLIAKDFQGESKLCTKACRSIPRYRACISTTSWRRTKIQVKFLTN
jgi:hypothetical protein